jgi:hypothetical protein
MVLFLFIVCTAGPLAAALSGGPWAGLGASLLAVLAWSYFGPRPMPGLVPGLLSTLVWLQNGLVLITSGVRLARSLLA